MNVLKRTFKKNTSECLLILQSTFLFKPWTNPLKYLWANTFLYQSWNAQCFTIN